MTSSVDLATHVKNALMGRWVVFEALDSFKPELTVAGCGTLVQAIERGVCDFTSYALDNIDARPLSEYLTTMVGELRSTIGFASAADKRYVMSLFQSVDGRIAQICGKEADPLQRLCNSILNVTLGTYEHFLSVPLGELFTSTEFKIVHVGVRPDLSFSPLAGSAQTITYSQPPALSQVKLQLSVREFDLLSFNSLPYAIFHECVSHVFQGPWNNARELPDASSLYAEGWMDFVTFLLYRRALEGGLIEINLPQEEFPELSRPSYSEAASALHYARRAESSRDRAWAYRAMGAQAAEWLLGRMTRLPDCAAGSDHAFLQLSLSINASALRQDEREDFSHLMHHALRRAESLAQITPLLRNYYRTRDIGALLPELWRLSSQWTTPANLPATPLPAGFGHYGIGGGSGGFMYSV